MLTPILSLCAALSVSGPSFATDYHFVVLGDGRGSEVGVNGPVITRLVQEIKNRVPRPKFLLFTGDLVGGDPDPVKYRDQLKHWVELMKPLKDAGITIYPVRGNHENRCKGAPGEAAWREIIASEYGIPTNGPANAKQLTYFAAPAGLDTLIVADDQYSYSGTPDHPLKFPSIDQPWLDGVFASQTQRHVFVFGHEQAFNTSKNHGDSLALGENAPERDAFLDKLIARGGNWYFAGHDHFYDHAYFYRQGGRGIHQVVAGTAGAPSYGGREYGPMNGWLRTEGKHIPYNLASTKTYGYIDVHVTDADETAIMRAFTGDGPFRDMDLISAG